MATAPGDEVAEISRARRRNNRARPDNTIKDDSEATSKQQHVKNHQKKKGGGGTTKTNNDGSSMIHSNNTNHRRHAQNSVKSKKKNTTTFITSGHEREDSKKTAVNGNNNGGEMRNNKTRQRRKKNNNKQQNQATPTLFTKLHETELLATTPSPPPPLLLPDTELAMNSSDNHLSQKETSTEKIRSSIQEEHLFEPHLFEPAVTISNASDASQGSDSFGDIDIDDDDPNLQQHLDHIYAYTDFLLGQDAATISGDKRHLSFHPLNSSFDSALYVGRQNINDLIFSSTNNTTPFNFQHPTPFPPPFPPPPPPPTTKTSFTNNTNSMFAPTTSAPRHYQNITASTRGSTSMPTSPGVFVSPGGIYFPASPAAVPLPPSQFNSTSFLSNQQNVLPSISSMSTKSSNCTNKKWIKQSAERRNEKGGIKKSQHIVSELCLPPPIANTAIIPPPLVSPDLRSRPHPTTAKFYSDLDRPHSCKF
uniref:Uncharacterized protein n=1 Tax=Aureoumbra lagunensis TaxID=44058 RepID=A0A7S3JYC5_9STRA|mmetsp:Transcript_15902/g.20920  ORF Transcript_15902/g.20920 Transcript_15902/m.20920 type:complete len:477 (+) Transcript_15902:93-1523(+)